MGLSTRKDSWYTTTMGGGGTSVWDVRPAAVVFDVDGLLVDTEPCWTVAETELFARRGLPFGDEQKALLIGRGLREACDGLSATFAQPGQGAAIAAELLDLVAEALDGHAEAMPGAHELVDLVAARVPVAVASNSPRVLMRAALDRGGFAGRFPVALCADDVTVTKPDPEMYLAACAALGHIPARCAAFEDSDTGVRAARAAGVFCLGVPTLPHVRLAADIVITSLRDPQVLEWVSRW